MGGQYSRASSEWRQGAGVQNPGIKTIRRFLRRPGGGRLRLAEAQRRDIRRHRRKRCTNAPWTMTEPAAPATLALDRFQDAHRRRGTGDDAQARNNDAAYDEIQRRLREREFAPHICFLSMANAALVGFLKLFTFSASYVASFSERARIWRRCSCIRPTH